MKIIKKVDKSINKKTAKASKPASKKVDKAMLAEMEALKAALEAAENKAREAEERVISLTSQVQKGTQPRANSTFTASAQSIIAGIGKGYLTREQGSEALAALSAMLISTVDKENKELKNVVACKIRHNILSNIRKQKDAEKAAASIDKYLSILETINANINHGVDIDLTSARAEVEARIK